MLHKLLCLVVLSAAIVAAQGPGPAPQQAAPEQAFITHQIIATYAYNADGTGVRTNEVRVQVLSAAGVEAMGQLEFGYNSESERLTIDYVRVRKPDGQVVVTSVEKAPEVSLEISRSAPMYTDYREKHISVSALSPGDTLEYKITHTLQHPLAANQFWLGYDFEKEGDVRDERLIVQVPKARDVRLKSLKPYSTEETATARIYSWKSSNVPKVEPKKGARPGAGEEEPSVDDVQLSTFRSWQEVAGWYDALARERAALTPELKARAAELVRGAATAEEKARRLYDFVGRSIRYVSLSFGTGRYQPHAAVDVLRNEYGDCKDKHTLLAALLQSAGIASHAVLIHFSNDLDPDVPAPSQFDHVITAAEIDGRRVWLDSTAGVAPFGLISPQLRGKQALLVSPELANPLVETPEMPPMTGQENMEVDGRFDEANTLEADFKITLLGDQAVTLRGIFRQTPQPKWTELAQNISYRAGYAGEVSAVKIDNLESIDQPFIVAYHYSRKAYFLPDDRDSSAGRKTLPLPPVAPEAATVARLKKGEKLMLRGPLSINQKVHLKFAKGQNPTAPISISLAREYGSFTSKYELKGDELTGERNYAITVPSMPASRLRDLQSFLTAINQDRDQMLVIKFAPGAMIARTESGADADSLNEAARARINAKDYPGAEQLAQQAVQADPKSQDAWNTLGVAYLFQSKYEKAESAFRKQVEVNPYDELAWNNLGRALQSLHRDDEAIAAYRKQIEIVPLDKWAHKSLGWLLFSAKKYSESAQELEKAVQINPDESPLKVLLAQAYSLSGEKEKANAMVARLSGSTIAPAPGGDYYLSAIHDDGDPEAAVRDAQAGLERLEQAFDFNEATDRGSSTAISVSALWGSKGWAYFRLGQLEKAERYLNAAWLMSQSAVIGSHLAQVYEKQDKKALAIQTYAQALAGEGRAPGAREKLIQLAGSAAKADGLINAARGTLTTKRTTFLHRRPAKASSAEMLLTFTNSEQPQKILFTGGTPALLDRYEAALKAQRFPIAYPDETTQHVVREAILYCGAAGCSVVLVPPSPQKAVLFPLAMPGTQ